MVEKIYLQGKKEDKESDISKDNKNSIKSYKIRWFVLASFAVLAFGVCLNSASHGAINNVLVHYFQVGAWQIDLLSSARCIIITVFTLPFAIISSRLGFKKTYIFQYSLFAIGLFLSAIGALFRQGYALTLCGQLITGLVSTLLAAQALETAAVWFPAHEVSIAVAVDTIARALGRGVGSIAPTLLVNSEMQNTDIKLRLASYYGGMTVLMVLMLISVIVFVDEAPDQPPSYAQAAVIKTKSKTGKTLETIKLLLRLFGGLLKNLQFLITTWAISTALAVIRYHITLLSSILHATFDNDISLNVKAGYALMGMSFAATLGGFIVGPIIRKHKNYKAMALLGLGGSFLSCLPMIAGILSKSLIAVEVGVVLQGLFCGFANPALYELLREVTYPKPAMQVTALTEGVTTLIVFSWLTSGRALLTNTKVVYAAGFPAVVLFFSGVFIACKRMKLHRQEAEDKGERRQLLGSDSEE